MDNPAAATPDSESDDEAARWEAAVQIRRERPHGVVIWLARKGEFRARPLFRALPGTVATGTTSDQLTLQKDEIQRTTGLPKRPARA
jgi:hypothetical protein